MLIRETPPLASAREADETAVVVYWRPSPARSGEWVMSLESCDPTEEE